jgi:predicted DNA-binding transcriptional regulator AlpA
MTYSPTAAPAAPPPPDCSATEHRAIFGTDPELLTANQVAAIVNLSRKRCYDLLGGIAIALSPRTLRWRRSDVLAWLESKQRGQVAA